MKLAVATHSSATVAGPYSIGQITSVRVGTGRENIRLG